MKKKTEIKKNDLKVKTEKKSNCNCVIGGVLGVLLLLGLVIYITTGPHLKFSSGDCLVRRDYTFVKVDDNTEYSYVLSPQRIRDFTDGWDLVKNENESYYMKQIDFVENNYSKVSCDNFVVRD